jgi:hypothetical protein
MTRQEETIMTSEFFRFFQLAGVLFIALGASLLILPLLLEKIPVLEERPWIIFYVYRKNGVVFATSPLLIIISLLSLVWGVVTQGRT